MKKKDNTIVRFCLPNKNTFSNSDEFMDYLTTLSKEKTDDRTRWGGFDTESDLHDVLSYQINEDDYKKYQKPSKEAVNTVRKNIQKSAELAQKKLSNPNEVLKVFAYPWFPSDNMKMFEGIMGKTLSTKSFHLYINFENFSTASLSETVAHEYNHMVFFNKRESMDISLLSTMIMEGLAEHFRENIIGGDMAAWSAALSDKQAVEEFKKLESLLDNTDMQLYRDVFFGSDEYSRWTGYCLGYKIVGNFLANKSNSPWNKIMEINPSEILHQSDFDD